MGPADLAVVATLADARSYSEAARRLGVAHTTVARRVRELEAYYSAKLFERGENGVSPTMEGERLVALARRLESDLVAVERDIRGQDQTLSGHIRLSTVDALAWRYMATLASFRRTNPGIELSIDISQAVRSLSRREAEMGLRLSNAPDETLHGRRIGQFRFVPVVRKDLLEELGADGLPWVEFGDRDCAAPTAKWMKANVAAERIGANVPTPLLMLRAIQAGMGAGLVPAELVEGRADLRILDEQPAFEMGIWLLTAPELRGLARIRAVFDAFAGRI
jgi:DNA-binding transcriptional LysR family regulator